jgi:hypothetical protein
MEESAAYEVRTVTRVAYKKKVLAVCKEARHERQMMPAGYNFPIHRVCGVYKGKEFVTRLHDSAGEAWHTAYVMIQRLMVDSDKKEEPNRELRHD